MNIFAHLKDTLSAAFGDLAEKRASRLGFFMLYMFIFSIITGIIVFCLMYIFIQIDGPSYGYRPSGWQNMISSFSKTGSTAALILIFLMPYYKSRKYKRNKSYSIGEMFGTHQITEWGFFAIGIVITLVASYFIASEMGNYYGPSYSSLDGILANIGFRDGSGLEGWIMMIIQLVISYIPLFVLAAYMIRLKAGKFSWNLIGKYWKHFLTLLISFIVITAGYEAILAIVIKIVLGLIMIPIQEGYIIGLLAFVMLMFTGSFYYWIMSKVAFYSFFADTNPEEEEEHIIGDDGDLLDQ